MGGIAELIARAATLAWEDPDDPWLEDAAEVTGMGFNLAFVAASTT